uniref:Ubiquitin-like domain-containing protein n=1 Tax=Mesocestoides corti TaxID=53468 RepID=A0A5K3EZR4_MESCO
ALHSPLCSLRGIFLEDSHPLRDYQLPKLDVVVPLELYLRASYKKPTHVKISLSADRTLTMPIRLDAKVSELRSAIKSKFPESVNQLSEMVLLFDHWLLDDNESLEAYGIKRDSCIVVARRLPGSYPSITSYDYIEDIQPKLPSQDDEMSKLKVHISANNVDPLTLYLDRNSTLQEVSEEVERETGVPINHQQFSLKKDLPHVSDLSRSLEDLGLNDGDTLHLVDTRSTNTIATEEPKNSESATMLIQFKDPNNTFFIQLARDSTVLDAMNALKKEIGGTPGPLWLKNTADGNYLQDYGSLLSEVGVVDGATIEYLHLPVKSEWISK